MATMKQIAEIAGVSRGTVDRVLNHRGSVRPDTEQRIMKVAAALNYTPNQAARSLSFAKQQLKLGCILFNPKKIDFFQQVLDGMEKKRSELLQYSVSVVIRFSDFDDPSSQDRLLDELAAEGVHGIALFGINLESTQRKISELRARGIPVITSNTDIPNSRRLAYVGCDYVKSGRVAGQLINLLLKGQGKLAVAQGAHNILCLEGRLQGVQDYLVHHAPNIRTVEIRRNNQDDFTMFTAVQEMLQKHPDLDALLIDAASSYGACRAIELFAAEQKPFVIAYDCIPKTQEMLKKGIITATITQQPEIQGALPLELLLEYLGADIMPEKEFYFTDLEIKISENL